MSDLISRSAVMQRFIDEIEQSKNRYIHCQDDWNNGIDQAIEIVKAGGKSETN